MKKDTVGATTFAFTTLNLTAFCNVRKDIADGRKCVLVMCRCDGKWWHHKMAFCNDFSAERTDK